MLFERVHSGRLGSIPSTLNHLMVGDRIWLARFAGKEVPLLASTPSCTRTSRNCARRGEPRTPVSKHSPSVSTRSSSAGQSLRQNEGKPYEDPVSLLVTHFFNHQTHHRGQIHDMLTQTDVPPPVLDLHRVIRPEPEE